MMNFKNAQKVGAKCLIKFTDTYSTCLVKNPFHLYNYNDPGAIDLCEILFLPLEHKIHIFSPPCNILYFCFPNSF